MKKLLILLSVFLMICISVALSENDTTSLPAFVYQGSEKYVGAVCQYILNVENTACAADEAAIPCIVILETDDSDPEDVRLWGDFAVFNYKLVNTTLMCQSGGSFLGMIRLKTVGDSWEVVSVDKVGDGDDYSADVERIFGLRDGLLERFEAHSNMMDTAQVQSVSDYVNWNDLAVTQLQNFGWNPVPLINAPDTPEDAQIVHFDSILGYSIDYDLREFSYSSYDVQEEGFSGVGVLDGISLMIELRSNEDTETVAAAVSAGMDKPTIENAAFGMNRLPATLVYDASLPGNVNRNMYILPVADGCLVISMCNTYYYAGLEIVPGGNEALARLLATFHLN